MLTAASEVFGAHGFQSASMDEIARRSGITKAMLYQYFTSKEGLYAACVERERAATFRAIAAAVENAPPEQRLRVFVESYFRTIRANRDSWWLLYGEAGGAAVNEMRQRNADVIERALVEALGDREGVDLLTQAIVGAGEQVGRWWVEHPDVPEAVVVDRFVAFVAAAIAALPSAASD